MISKELFKKLKKGINWTYYASTNEPMPIFIKKKKKSNHNHNMRR